MNVDDGNKTHKFIFFPQNVSKQVVRLKSQQEKKISPGYNLYFSIKINSNH